MGKKNKKTSGQKQPPKKEDSVEKDAEQVVSAQQNGSEVETAGGEGEGSPEIVADSMEKVQTVELEGLVSKQKDAIDQLREQLKDTSVKSDNEEINSLKEQLAASEQARAEADEQYQELLGKISTIRETLGERLKRDSQALKECREELAQRDAKEAEQQSVIEQLKTELIQSSRDQSSLTTELTGLRKESEDSYEKWQRERDLLIKEKQKALDKAHQEHGSVQDLEIALQEEKTVRDGFTTKIADLEDQITSQTQYAEQFRHQRDGLQTELDAVKNQLEEKALAFTKQVGEMDQLNQGLEKRATDAEQEMKHLVKKCAELEETAASVEPLKAEVKEKGLLVGKLRHEAVILNEHLTKTLKFVKQGSEGENVDKLLVTNLIISFLQIPRGDSKKFEVLQLMSSMLGWDEEQKVQAGLARGTDPGSGLNSPRRSQSSNNIPGESFANSFAEYLEREATRSVNARQNP